MIYDVFPSAVELNDIVKQYVVITSLQDMDKLLFLPNGCNFIVFNRRIDGYLEVYRDDKKFPIPKNYSISVKNNRIKRFILNDNEPNSGIKLPFIMVELTPIGFYKLFNMEATILNNCFLEIQQSVTDEYFSKLYTKSRIEDELEYLNCSLNRLQCSQNNCRMCIQDVMDKIIDVYRFEVSINMLTEEFGCSRSKIEREFKKNIGFTPKNYIYISKFCKTVLAYIEDDCGFNEMEYLYSDYSHMNSVFKKFFGTNPSVVFDDVTNNRIQLYQMRRVQEYL
jgi:AraC-like DNA-binding protein